MKKKRNGYRMTEKKRKKVEDQQFLENLENLCRNFERTILPGFRDFRDLESLQFFIQMNNYGYFNIFEKLRDIAIF